MRKKSIMCGMKLIATNIADFEALCSGLASVRRRQGRETLRNGGLT